MARTKTQGLTESGKDQIAREVAYGLAKKQVAAYHGYTLGGLNSLLAKPDMKRRIEDAADHLMACSDQAMIQLSMYMDDAAKNIIAIAGDPDHKDRYRANKDILDWFRPPADSKGDAPVVTVNVATEQMSVMTKEIKVLQQVLAKADFRDRILEGVAAVPTAFSEEEGDNLAIEAKIEEQ